MRIDRSSDHEPDDAHMAHRARPTPDNLNAADKDPDKAVSEDGDLAAWDPAHAADAGTSATKARGPMVVTMSRSEAARLHNHRPSISSSRPT